MKWKLKKKFDMKYIRIVFKQSDDVNTGSRKGTILKRLGADHIRSVRRKGRPVTALTNG